MNRTKKYADGRWKELIVLILISVSFVALVMSAGKTFLLVEFLNDHNRKPTPSPTPTLVFQALKSSLGMCN